MNAQLFARELFKWVLLTLQIVNAALGGSKLVGWVDWLSGQEATIMLLMSGLIGAVQAFMNKPKTPKVPAVVGQLFGGTIFALGLAILCTGCTCSASEINARKAADVERVGKRYYSSQSYGSRPGSTNIPILGNPTAGEVKCEGGICRIPNY